MAVLPFVNVSGDSNSDYLSDGITESLINSLSQLPHLKVMSRDSAFRYKGKETDAEVVGRALGVRAIFKGRITQRGDSLAISAELVDARDDSHIWGEQYSRKVEDIFVLQREIAKEITTALRMRLTGEDEKRMAKSFTANSEAYQDYLKGRFWWNKRTQDGIRKGIDYFQQAIGKDPNYALAYSGLADSYSLLANNGFVLAKDAYPRAKAAAQKAMEIDDSLAEAHTSLGYVKTQFEWDWSGADRELQRSIELNPGSAVAHDRYGTTLGRMGRLEEGVAEKRRALELDPLSPIINRNLGIILYVARQYDQAIEQGRKTLEMDPNYIGVHSLIGQAYFQKRMYKEGVAEVEKELAISPGNPVALSWLGYGYANEGRKAEAQTLIDKLDQLSRQRYIPAWTLADIYVGLGEKDKAFEWLEKAYDERFAGLTSSIKVDPIFDSLRAEPRFQDLLRRMNLQP